MLSNKVTYSLLAVIIVLFLIIGVLYATRIPAWQNPDEPAHFNYIEQVAAAGCCPIIEEQDWDAEYLGELTTEKFPADADLTNLEYEDHQPPLYYMLGIPVIQFCEANCLSATRILSVLLGLGVVLAAFWSVARLFPEKRIWALASAAFVAFLPQHVAMLSSTNNDSLAELVLGILLVVAITYVGNPGKDGSALGDPQRPHAAALGGLAGVAFVTKLTIYVPVVLVVAAAVLLRWRREGRSWSWLIEQVVWAGGLALLIGVLWWIRNAVTYGWPDLFGLAAHDAVVSGQLRTADYIASVGFGQYMRDVATITFHSYWGQFGWMAVPMQPRTYLLIGAFTAWNVIGLGLALVRLRKDGVGLTPAQSSGVWLLGAAAAGTLFNFVYYNIGFLQLQGRYLFTALIPFALVVTLGSWGWARLIGDRIQDARLAQIAAWLPLVAVSWMPVLALWALFRFAVPNL